MFGYVRPLRCQLRLCEDELYKAAYCGLCHTMAKRHSWIARYLLDFDFAFLALALSAGQMPQKPLRKTRCPAHPFKRRPACHPSAAFDIAADDSLILAVWKMRDNVADSGFWKGLPFRMLCGMFRKSFSAAERRRPDFADEVRESLRLLNNMEKTGLAAVDPPADAFARLLEAMASGAPEEQILRPAFYHIGRWIYIIDAADDLKRDFKHRQYNPVAARFGITDGTLTAGASAAITTTLAHSRIEISNALSLLPEDAVKPILLNIAELGLPNAENLVLTGKWKKRRKQKDE